MLRIGAHCDHSGCTNSTVWVMDSITGSLQLQGADWSCQDPQALQHSHVSSVLCCWRNQIIDQPTIWRKMEIPPHLQKTQALWSVSALCPFALVSLHEVGTFGHSYPLNGHSSFLWESERFSSSLRTSPESVQHHLNQGVCSCVAHFHIEIMTSIMLLSATVYLAGS